MRKRKAHVGWCVCSTNFVVYLYLHLSVQMIIDFEFKKNSLMKMTKALSSQNKDKGDEIHIRRPPLLKIARVYWEIVGLSQ